MTALPKFPFSNVGSWEWYNSQGNILNCSEPFFSNWLNSLCRITFGMLFPQMIVFTFLVCFLPVVIVTAYGFSTGTTFLFAKTVYFSGWLLTTTWERWDGITDWFLQKYVSYFLLQIHQCSKETGIYSLIQNLLILSSFSVLVWKNFLAI